MGLFGFGFSMLRLAGKALGDEGPLNTSTWLPPDTLLPQFVLVAPVPGFEGFDGVLRTVATEVGLELGRSVERLGNFLVAAPVRVPDPASLWYLAGLVSRHPRCLAAVLCTYDPGLEVEACWSFREGALKSRSGQQWRDSRAYARHNPERFSGVPPTDDIARKWPMTQLAQLAGVERQQLVDGLRRLSAS